MIYRQRLTIFSKRIILSHEDGMGGSFRYEHEEMLYDIGELQSFKQTHNQINDILIDIKTKLTTLDHLHTSLQQILAKSEK